MKLIPLDGNTAQWVWENLVPRSGQADSVQGEVLRAIEKLAWEAQKNGNINWDVGFEKLVSFLKEVFLAESSFTERTKKSIETDLSRLENFIFPTELENREQAHLLPCVDDALYDRLEGYLVEFCIYNQKVIALKEDPEQYR